MVLLLLHGTGAAQANMCRASVYVELSAIKELRKQPNEAGELLDSAFEAALGNGLNEYRDYDRAAGYLKSIEADSSNAVQDLSFTWDKVGNLLSRANANIGKTETFTYDERDRLALRMRGVDHAPALQVRYEHDSLDQLIGVHDAEPEPWTASYDGLGRRISCGRGERQTTFWWDGDRLAAETFPDATFRIYVYAREDAPVPIGFVDYDSVDAAPASGRAYSVFSDQVGLPLCIADAKGEIVWWAEHVDTYGAVRVRAGALVEYNLRWPGHYFDPDTGLHYNRFRYYEPRLGRYLESDPLGCAGSVNLYAYTKNPLVGVDVLGLHDEEAHPAAERGRPTHERPPMPAKAAKAAKRQATVPAVARRSLWRR